MLFSSNHDTRREAWDLSDERIDDTFVSTPPCGRSNIADHAATLVVESSLSLRVPGVGVGGRSAKRISQYAHAAWRIQDGFFRGNPSALAQTKDGYLWVGTDAGLLRFDGVRFVPWQAEHGERLPSAAVLGLLAPATEVCGLRQPPV